MDEYDYSVNSNVLNNEEIDRKLIGLARKNYRPTSESAYAYGASGNKAGISGYDGEHNRVNIPELPIKTLRDSYKPGQVAYDDAYYSTTGMKPYANMDNIQHDAYRTIHTHPTAVLVGEDFVDVSKSMRPPSASDYIVDATYKLNKINHNLPDDNYSLITTYEDNLPVTYQYAARSKQAQNLRAYAKAANDANESKNIPKAIWYNTNGIAESNRLQNRYKHIESTANTIAAIRAKADSLLDPNVEYMSRLFEHRGNMLPKLYQLNGDFVNRLPY